MMSQNKIFLTGILSFFLYIPSTFATEIHWPAVKNGTSYIIEISQDKKFAKKILRTKTTKPHFFWNSSKPGLYFFRISYFDKHNRQSPFSKASQLIIRHQAPSLISPQGELKVEEQKEISFQWSELPHVQSYKVQVAKDDKFKNIVLEKKVTSSELETTNLSSGQYFWRTQTTAPGQVNSAWSSASQFKLKRVPYIPKETFWNFEMGYSFENFSNTQKAAPTTNTIPNGKAQSSGQTTYSFLLSKKFKTNNFGFFTQALISQGESQFSGSFSANNKDLKYLDYEGALTYSPQLFNKYFSWSVGLGAHQSHRRYFSVQNNQLDITTKDPLFLKQYFLLQWRLARNWKFLGNFSAREPVETFSSIFFDANAQIKYKVSDFWVGLIAAVHNDKYKVQLSSNNGLQGDANITETWWRYGVTFAYEL